MINFDYFLVEYKLMHSLYKKYLSSDSDIKAHALETWKQTMVLISDYCKEHNCSDEFKWQFIEIETFESQKNSEAEHKSPDGTANSLGVVKGSINGLKASDGTADISSVQEVPDVQKVPDDQKDWLLNAPPPLNDLPSSDDEPEPMDTSGLPLSHEGHPILGKHKVFKKWQYLVWLKESVAVWKLLVLQDLNSDDDILLIKQHEKGSHKDKTYKKLKWMAMLKKQAILKGFDVKHSEATVLIVW